MNSWHDPRKHVECYAIKKPFEDAFAADSFLEGYLKDSILSLKSMLGQENDTQARPNICNADRVVNIATLYLAQVLGVSLTDIIEDYTYVATATHVFPNDLLNPITVYIPDNEPGFPDLEQIYWSIIDQFTRASEPNIRKDKSPLWCWYVGVAVNDHCRSTKNSKSCAEDICSDIWKYFLEACHRVRSIDTSSGDYALRPLYGPSRYCLWIPHQDYKAYYISRKWSLGCPDMGRYLRDYADTSVIDGYLHLYQAVDPTSNHVDYRVPGTAFKYKCSTGFGLPDYSNPDREIMCQGNRKADFSAVTENCKRKYCKR